MICLILFKYIAGADLLSASRHTTTSVPFMITPTLFYHFTASGLLHGSSKSNTLQEPEHLLGETQTVLVMLSRSRVTAAT